MDRQICPSGHNLASRGSPSDAKRQICLSIPDTHVRFLEYHMSRIVRKLEFCLCGSASPLFSLHGYYNFSSKIQNFKLLSCFCDCTSLFVSDLVGNPKDPFSLVGAHTCSILTLMLSVCKSPSIYSNPYSPLAVVMGKNRQIHHCSNRLWSLRP